MSLTLVLQWLCVIVIATRICWQIAANGPCELLCSTAAGTLPASFLFSCPDYVLLCLGLQVPRSEPFHCITAVGAAATSSPPYRQTDRFQSFTSLLGSSWVVGESNLSGFNSWGCQQGETLLTLPSFFSELCRSLLIRHYLFYISSSRCRLSCLFPPCLELSGAAPPSQSHSSSQQSCKGSLFTRAGSAVGESRFGWVTLRTCLGYGPGAAKSRTEGDLTEGTRPPSAQLWTQNSSSSTQMD